LVKGSAAFIGDECLQHSSLDFSERRYGAGIQLIKQF